MALTTIKFLQQFAGPDGLHNGGEIAGYPSALADQLIADNIAVLYNDGVPAATPFRGQGEAETNAQYLAAATAAGTTPGPYTPSAPIQAFQGNYSITAGIIIPDAD